MSATCAGILRETFPQIDEEMFSYINGKIDLFSAIIVEEFILRFPIRIRLPP